MNRISILLFFLFSISSFSCYEDPFYELLIYVVNQDNNKIEEAEVTVYVPNKEGGILENATVYESGVTDDNGMILFNFENLGFFSVYVYKEYNPNEIVCRTISVALEENVTVERTVQVLEGDCVKILF